MQDLNSTLCFKNQQEIQEYQWTKIKKALDYLQNYSPFYQKLFQQHNIFVEKIQSWEDFQKLPFTIKDDLQKYNEDFLCISKDKIIDYCTTSGTLGAPVTFGLSDEDLERLAYNEAYSFIMAGVKKGDVVQLMTTMDKRFMAGLAYFLGLRKIGASAIRMGAGVPELQWDSILRYKPKFIVTVPSFLLKMIEYAEKHGINYNETSVQGAICIGEAIRNDDFSPNTLSEKICKKWNIKLFSTYASTEMSTAFTECEKQNGGHLNPKLIIAEILDENDHPVKEGELGELVITTLGVTAMPLLRFRTGDLLRAHYSPCNCGRNTMRLGAVVGRKQQMVKYKGTTLYPPAIQNVLAGVSGVKLHQIIVTKNDIGTDEILVKVATDTPNETFLQEIRNHFRAKLRVTPKLIYEEFSVLEKLVFPSTSRKPITFLDKR